MLEAAALTSNSDACHLSSDSEKLHCSSAEMPMVAGVQVGMLQMNSAEQRFDWQTTACAIHKTRAGRQCNLLQYINLDAEA